MTWTFFWNLKHTYIINIQTIFFLTNNNVDKLFNSSCNIYFWQITVKHTVIFLVVKFCPETKKKIQVKKFQTQPVKPDHFKRFFFDISRASFKCTVANNIFRFYKNLIRQYKVRCYIQSQSSKMIVPPIFRIVKSQNQQYLFKNYNFSLLKSAKSRTTSIKFSRNKTAFILVRCLRIC